MYRIWYNKVINFGKYRGWTGKQLSRTKEGRRYLRWAYSRSNIWVSDFTVARATSLGRRDYY